MKATASPGASASSKAGGSETSAAFLKGDNKRVVGSGGDPWEGVPRSTDWRAD